MPYITRWERPHFDPHIQAIAERLYNPGQLTYIICKLLWSVWKHNNSFRNWCQWSKAVEEAVIDFRDRHITVNHPWGYENQKMCENGDVYE